MNIGIVSPYLDSLGGGERYMLSIASCASNRHSVRVFWDDANILEQAEERFHIDLKHTAVAPNVFLHGSLFKKLQVTHGYDVIFFLTDGGIPISLAKHNILHVQVPFSNVKFPVWKKYCYDSTIYNSEFTKNHIALSLRQLPSQVIYPPIESIQESSTSKSKMIISVGRFGGLYNAKKFDVLIEAFKKFVNKKKYESYSLSLAGGLHSNDSESFAQLKKTVNGYPISFYPNCTYKTLKSLYEQSEIYWHAAGFGETKPENMEHFGIAPVEAMSTGTIPIVFNGGGLPEIITDGENGYLWNTIDELVEKTQRVVSNPAQLKKLSTTGKSSSLKFSYDVFNSKIDDLLRELESKI